jgi:hypothetical protein
MPLLGRNDYFTDLTSQASATAGLEVLSRLTIPGYEVTMYKL